MSKHKKSPVLKSNNLADLGSLVSMKEPPVVGGVYQTTSRDKKGNVLFGNDNESQFRVISIQPTKKISLHTKNKNYGR